MRSSARVGYSHLRDSAPDDEGDCGRGLRTGTHLSVQAIIECLRNIFTVFVTETPLFSFLRNIFAVFVTETLLSTAFISPQRMDCVCVPWWFVVARARMQRSVLTKKAENPQRISSVPRERNTKKKVTQSLTTF